MTIVAYFNRISLVTKVGYNDAYDNNKAVS